MTKRAIDIKRYLTTLFVKEDAVLSAIKKGSKEAGSPDIDVPSTVGKLLYSLAKIQRPKRILEIGTLAGYSTVWLARALPEEGSLLSLELEPRRVEIARGNIRLAGLEKKVEVRQGLAKELLDQMIEQKEEPFDLIFIDADKANYPLYLTKALQLSRIGTLLLIDNLIPKGDNIGGSPPDSGEAESIYRFNQQLAAHPQLESILVTTIVGEQGRIDALGLSIVSNLP